MCMPRPAPFLPMARMAALRPGLSPPAVRTPIQVVIVPRFPLARCAAPAQCQHSWNLRCQVFGGTSSTIMQRCATPPHAPAGQFSSRCGIIRTTAETRKLAFNGSDPFRGTGQLPMMPGGTGRLRGELLSHKSVIYNIFYYKLFDLVLLKLLFSTSLKKFQTWNLLGQADSGGR